MDRDSLPRTLTPETRLTVRRAAALASCSDDTIRRRLAEGVLPGARQAGGGNREWTIPVEDLIAAGLVHPDVLDPTTPAGASRTGVDPEIVALLEKVAGLAACADALEQRIRDKDEEIAYLRSLTKKLAG